MFRYLLFKIGQALICFTPRKFAFCLAVFISDLQYHFSKIDRYAVKANLEHVLREGQDIDHTAREIFRNFGCYLVEFFLMRKLVTPEFIRDCVSIEGLNHLDKAMDHQKGVIVLSAHLGNWELGAACLSTLGYPVHAVALPHKQQLVNDLFNAQREAKGITIIPSHLAVRQCLKTLREAKVVAIVGDRDFKGGGKPMDFLGKTALIPRGAAALSLKTQSPILPVFFTRENDGFYKLVICDAISPGVNTNISKEEDIENHMMKKIVHVIEKKIKQNPSQWMMFREFWES